MTYNRLPYTKLLIDYGANPDWYAGFGISLHHYAYRLRAIDHLKMMNKLHEYTDRLTSDAVHIGTPRPPTLIRQWTQGWEMAETTIILYGDGTGIFAQAVIGGFRCLWEAEGNLVKLYQVNPMEDRILTTPDITLYYNAHENSLENPLTNDKFYTENDNTLGTGHG